MKTIAITNTATLRAIAHNPAFKSEELFTANPRGHKFKVGQTCTLAGLTQFPEFNGQPVTITAIREDSTRGRAYYINGKINEFMNWIYEDRLT